MPLIARVGVDMAGGLQLGNAGAKFTVEGAAVVLVGDSVMPHPIGPPHSSSPVMVQGSSKVTLHGIPVCREGHLASCGHPTTGSSKLIIP